MGTTEIYYRCIELSVASTMSENDENIVTPADVDRVISFRGGSRRVSSIFILINYLLSLEYLMVEFKILF